MESARRFGWMVTLMLMLSAITGIHPMTVAATGTGDVYVSSFGTGEIIKVDPAGTQTTYAAGLGSPGALKFDKLGNLYVLNYNNGNPQILKVTPTGTVSTIATGLPEGSLNDLTVADDGTLFLLVPATDTMDQSVGQVWQYALDGTSSLVASTLLAALRGQNGRGFTCGPDGALYLAMQSGNVGGRIMRVSRSGDVSTYYDPKQPSFDQGGVSMIDVRFNAAGEMLILGNIRSNSGNPRTLWKVRNGIRQTFGSGEAIWDSLLQLTIDRSDTLYMSGAGFGTTDVIGAIQTVNPSGVVTTLTTFPPISLPYNPIFDIDDRDFDACPTLTPPAESIKMDAGGGRQATTDIERDGATLTDPVETSVRTPIAGLVSIDEAEQVGQAPSGFVFLGHTIKIQAPTNTTIDPLRLTFRIDASRISSDADLNRLTVVRDGIAISNCSSGTMATPNPCIQQRSRVSGNDVEVIVRTSQGGEWWPAMSL